VRRRWGSHASAFPRVDDLLLLLWALVVSGIFFCVILGAAGGRGEGPFQVECGSAVSRCRELMYSMYSRSSYTVCKVYSA
jgi:hypothetical protein